MTTNAELAALITAALARFDNVTDEVELLKVKGTVATVSALPAGASSGDAYVVAEDGHLYGWITTLWLDFGVFRGAKGDQGDEGWSPVLSVVTDGARRVHRIVAWTGGAGDPPASGSYLGPAGVVTDIADAVDIRGGVGSQGQKGWSLVPALVADGARLVLQVDDWTGGEGDKPEVGDYVGPAGLVSSIAAAVDVRGGIGLTGPAAWAAPAPWSPATAYTATAPRSVVTQGGRSYVCLTSHTSGTFSTDLAANRWIMAADKGADGLGTGTVQHTGTPGAGQLARFADGSGDLLEGVAATKGLVGLGNVDNTSDADKPISDDTQAALDLLSAELAAVSASAVAPNTIVRIMLALAELKANQWGTPNGIADDFADQDYVDLTGSTGQAYDGSAKSYKTTTTGDDITPANMTGASAPSGYSMRAATEFDGTTYPAWKARDGNPGSGSVGRFAAGNTTPWLEAGFPTPQKFTAYTITGSTDAGESPSGWTLWGHTAPMGGSGGTLLDTRSSQTGWGASGVRSFTISSPAKYQYYELRITGSNGVGVTSIGEWQFTPSTDPADPVAIDLRSVALTALAVPTKANLLVLAKRSGGITLGTHLTAYVSRNNGANWQAVTLVAREVAGGFTVYEALNVSLASLPSGTAMRWRLTGNGDGTMEVGAVVLLWN